LNWLPTPFACHKPRVPADWIWLLETARAEVAETVGNLPADLRPHAESVPVTYESWPDAALIEDGWEEDLLGMFVGDPIGVTDVGATPRQIILFLENLWNFAEEDETLFREEVHITYIHEFGHYLGLDEDELEERGLL
jgi:predicted Zn-dependent protease with MMP-like domain